MAAPSIAHSPASPAAPRRILLIRPSALGDVCRTTPVLASLHRGHPGAAIDWLVQDTFVPAVASHPLLHEAIPFPRKDLSRWWLPATWGPIQAFLSALRERRYDLVVDAQGLFRSGLFAAATEAPRRVGLANAAELGWMGLTEGVLAPRSLHTVDRMLAVARTAGGSREYVPEDVRLFAAEADREHVRTSLGGGLSPGSYLLLAPTTRWPAKTWPNERFAELASRLLAGPGAPDKIVFVGTASESGACSALRELAVGEPRLVDLLGKTSVGQLLAVVEGARLVVACDSAVLHMAVGFQRPLVALFGPTDVSRVGPYRREQDVLQHVGPGDTLDHKAGSAAGRALIERIPVGEVEAAVRSRLTA